MKKLTVLVHLLQDNAEFGHFKLFFCRGRQSVSRIIMLLHSHCIAHKRNFSDVNVSVVSFRKLPFLSATLRTYLIFRSHSNLKSYVTRNVILVKHLNYIWSLVRRELIALLLIAMTLLNDPENVSAMLFAKSENLPRQVKARFPYDAIHSLYNCAYSFCLSKQ